MLTPSTTELWTPSKIPFPDLPLASDGTVDIEACIATADTYCNEMMPNIANSYTAQHAEKRGGGNCYAQTDVRATLFEYWEIPDSFIVLSRHHASNMVAPPYTGEAIYFDDGGVYPPQPQVGLMGVSEGVINDLKDAHLAFTQKARDSEAPIGAYFWFDDSYDMHTTEMNDAVLTPLDLPVGVKGLHLVISARKGIEMLHAIGDLKRYHITKLLKYTEVYNSLISLVPTFIASSLPAPKVTESTKYGRVGLHE